MFGGPGMHGIQEPPHYRPPHDRLFANQLQQNFDGNMDENPYIPGFMRDMIRPGMNEPPRMFPPPEFMLNNHDDSP